MATSHDATGTNPVPQGALSGRCLVIIGGTQGLGWSAAQACLREGAQLVVVGLDPTPEVPQIEGAQDRLEVILADARETVVRSGTASFTPCTTSLEAVDEPGETDPYTPFLWKVGSKPWS